MRFNPDKALKRLQEVEGEIEFRWKPPVHGRQTMLEQMRERLIQQFYDNGYELVMKEG